MLLPGFVAELLIMLKESNTTPYLVGGCIRDYILGINPTDYDIEVHGTTMENLQQLLKSAQIDFDEVGKAFGVLIAKNKQSGMDVEIAIPRLDSKCGIGHKDFSCEFPLNITIEDALSRRDFTMNSLAMDPFNNKIIDPFGGKADIEEGRIRHTSSEKFADDPLRVLRAAQFASRFGMFIDSGTAELCSKIADQYATIPKERVVKEWTKMMLGYFPSSGLRVLEKTKWIENFPQIAALCGLRQEPSHHPEGDAFEHTCQVCDCMSRDIRRREEEEKRPIEREHKLSLLFAALCHDFGKASTTEDKDGIVISHGHDMAGVIPAAAFMNSIGITSLKFANRVCGLVANHMFHVHCGRKPSNSAIRRLAVKLDPATIDDLTMVMIADASGRFPIATEYKDRFVVVPDYVYEMRKIAREIDISTKTVKPILTGKHCIDFGMKPGPTIGKAIAGAFEAQLAGSFMTEAGAKLWLKKYLETTNNSPSSITESQKGAYHANVNDPNHSQVEARITITV